VATDALAVKGVFIVGDGRRGWFAVCFFGRSAQVVAAGTGASLEVGIALPGVVAGLAGYGKMSRRGKVNRCPLGLDAVRGFDHDGADGNAKLLAGGGAADTGARPQDNGQNQTRAEKMSHVHASIPGTLIIRS